MSSFSSTTIRAWTGLLLALDAGCGAASPVGESGHESASLPSAAPPVLFLVTIDTTRGDHVTADRMPFLSGLAADGLVFDNFGTQTWTYPGLGAILTGVHPTLWGAESWTGAPGVPAYLSSDVATLAERLAELGWATALWSANPIADMTGLRRGYSRYAEYIPGSTAEAAAEIVTWAGQHPDEPRFVHLHLNNDHSPYDLFGEGCSERVAAVDTGVCRWDFVRSNDDSMGANEDVNLGSFSATSDDYAACVELLQTAYSCEVSRQDQELQATWELLDGAGLLADALVVIATDHGEGLLDPWTNHAFDPRTTIIDGWAMARWPGHLAAGVASAPLVQEDIVPTIASLLALELGIVSTGVPYDEVPADRIRTTFYGGATPAQPWGQVHSAYDASWHYIRGLDGPLALFNLVDDPHELTDLGKGGLAPPDALVLALEAQMAATEGFVPSP